MQLKVSDVVLMESVVLTGSITLQNNLFFLEPMFPDLQKIQSNLNL